VKESIRRIQTIGTQSRGDHVVQLVSFGKASWPEIARVQITEIAIREGEGGMM
jgi:hypothetical protein